MQSYFYNDDTFNFNYAQAKAAVGNYKEAEEVGSHFSIFTLIKIILFFTPRKLVAKGFHSLDKLSLRLRVIALSLSIKRVSF